MATLYQEDHDIRREERERDGGVGNGEGGRREREV